MKIHFIAIGGSVMHNLALALRRNHDVSGSDDEIFEPAYSRLKSAGLLPEKTGWFPEKINNSIDEIVLGMHARADNPELIKAKELGIPVYSFPEYIYSRSVNKKRVVIAGSHGKTSTTAMIMHVLKTLQIDFDYMVGAQLDGFNEMVKLSDAPLIILEGDEYPDSALNRTPKFLFYKANIGLITGIAWDHVNIFPTFEEYQLQFRKFISSVDQNGCIIYNDEDEVLAKVCNETPSAKKISYRTLPYSISNGITTVHTSENNFTVHVFGKHNLQNMAGALKVCEQLGITEPDFAKAIQNFGGAAKRLEKIGENHSTVIFRDFAHSPSKLKATIDAVAEQFPERKIIAVFELHTFSSLTETFLKEYDACMNNADEQIVYYSPHALELKKLPPLNKETIEDCFDGTNLSVFNSKVLLEQKLKTTDWEQTVLLLMSSGTYDNLDITSLTEFILNQKH